MREMRIETCCDSDDSMANSLRCWHSRTELLILHEFLFWPNIHRPTMPSTNRYALQSHRKLQLTDSDMSANLDIPLGVPQHKLWFTINRFKQSHLDSFFFVSSLKSTNYNGCKIKLEPKLKIIQYKAEKRPNEQTSSKKKEREKRRKIRLT